MTKKKWLAIGCLVAALIAVLALRWGGRDTDKRPQKAAKKTDPHTLARSTAARDAVRIDPRSEARVRLAGRVTATTGEPIAGAHVCTKLSSRDLANTATRTPVCTQTNAKGAYVLSDLMPARHRVTAVAPHYLPTRYRDKKRSASILMLAGEQRLDIDIVLSKGGAEARGVVKDIGGGPIAGAHVTVDGSWNSVHGPVFAVTNAAGQFALWTAPGRISVTAHADGYASGTVDGRAPGAAVEVLLTPESVLAGRVVVVGTNEPVANAKVELEVSRFTRQGSTYTAFTDAAGRFRIAGIRPGRFKPVATAAGFYGEARESVLLGLGQTRDDLVVEVHRAVVVTGQVSLPDKSPCQRGGVVLSDEKQALEQRSSTDRSGNVTFKAVLPGTYEVRTYCRDYVGTNDAPHVIVVDADISGLQWHVDGGVSIVGQVVDSARQPVEGASITARTVAGAARARRSWGNDATRSDGQFEIHGLRPGTFDVSASAPQFASAKAPTEVQVAAGENKTVEFVLDRGGSIQGDVVDEHGKPVSKISVRAAGAHRGGWSEWGKSQSTTDDDGKFEITGLRPGSYRVTPRRSWRNQLRRPGSSDDDVQGKRLDVTSGSVSRVHLVVEAQSGTITGTVVDETGNPVADAFVSGQRESDASGASGKRARRSVRWTWQQKPVLTDMDGTFTLTNLSGGTYTVRAYRRGGGEAFAEAVPVGSTTATITIKATGSVAGSVTLDDGRTPSQFSISLTDRSAGFRRSESFFRTGGVWTIRDLPAGSFTVAVSAAEGTARTELTLRTGQDTTGVTLLLESRVQISGQVVGLEDKKPIPGIYVSARPVKGRDSMAAQSNKQRRYITDADGRFTLDRAPTGRLYITCFPMDWEKSPYTMARKLLTVKGGLPQDIGIIAMPMRRTKPRERGGEFGFTLKETDPEVEPENRTVVVSFIRPDGPAAGSGLAIGDEIVAVDGHDVRGGQSYLYWALTKVSPGRTVSFGLKRGPTLKLTAAPPK